MIDYDYDYEHEHEHEHEFNPQSAIRNPQFSREKCPRNGKNAAVLAVERLIHPLANVF